MLRTALTAAAALVCALAFIQPASAATLRAGVGQADITPPKTGYYLGGWTRADWKAEGQHSRLFSKALVLEQGERKVAFVVVELFMVPGGLQQHVARALSDLGYDRSSVVITATHTHAGPGGFANYATLNSGAPNAQMLLTEPGALDGLLNPEKADPQLYAFLLRQIVSSVRDADADLAPAVAGWGRTQLHGLTRNRSLEAHLHNHGLKVAPGRGRAEQDPHGAEHTVDPNVDVLRVDHVSGSGARTPIGAWSQFANHATTVPGETRVYTGDHPGVAMRVFEDAVRREADVPADRTLVNLYGSSAAGDQTATVDRHEFDGAKDAGRQEGEAMLKAWRAAGEELSDDVQLDHRWTQLCFCGQRVEGGSVARQAFPGLPFLTGSEEGRGPLFEVTKTPLEGAVAPLELSPGHGRKAIVPVGQFPQAVPLTVIRVGSQLIATIPGEGTKEAGVQLKAAVQAQSAALGIDRVLVAGLTNEYINYITTQAEYDRQHYEGGSTMYGRYELAAIKAGLSDLTARLAAGQPAPAPREYDAIKGVATTGPAYPAGASVAAAITQPAAVAEPGAALSFSWQGGPAGADRPLGAAFVRIEHKAADASEWAQVDSDLGVELVWRVTPAGKYTARWELPSGLGAGELRFVVTATGYRLESQPTTIG